MATPTVWLDEFDEFNASAGTGDNGGNDDPQIIGLANGNILIAWTEQDDAVATANDDDIVGRIYDAAGNIVKDTFQLNTNQIDTENDFDIASTNDGGFVLVYVDAIGTSSAIRWQRFDAAGNSIDFASVADEGGASESVSNPQISVNLTDNSSYVTFERDDGTDTEVMAVRLDANGNIATTEFNAAQTFPTSDTDDSDSAILTNGNLVTVYVEEDGGDDGIELAVRDSSGNSVVNLINVTAANGERDPQVAALSGGGFVVVWQEFTEDIKYAVYSNTGTPVQAEAFADAGTIANSQNEPEVVALPDGGFVILWDDDTADTLEARAFLADGTPDGAAIEIGTAAREPNIGVTGDGRVVFVWEDVVTGGEIQASIWDPREGTVEASDYSGTPLNFVSTNVVTARPASGTLNGTDAAETLLGHVGNDTIFGRGGADTISGGDGNDTILGGHLTDTINGGSGNDLIRVLAGEFFDNVVGGSGTDTLDHSSLTRSGDTFDFLAGKIISSFDVGTPTIQGIEIYRDGSGGNTIVSNGSGQYFGNGGNDTLRAGNGTNEMLDGGSGVDLLDATHWNGTYVINLITGVTNYGESFVNFENVTTGNGNDTITGTAGANVIRTNGGNDIVEGGGGTDTVITGAGNDTILVKASHQFDNVNGGSGTDTLDHSAVTRSGDVFDFAAGKIFSSFDTGTPTLAGIEIYQDGSGGNTIKSTGAGTYHGNGGNDTLWAGTGAGPETLNGGDGTDLLVTAALTGDIVVNLSTGGTNIAGKLFTDFENVITGSGKDTVTGTADNNSVSTGSGDDRAFGLGGNDFLRGVAGSDRLFGGAGADNVLGGSGNDRILGGGGDDRVLGGGGSDKVAGGAGSDKLFGNAEADSIFGGGGGDIIRGGGGKDVAKGGAGTDKINGNGGNDLVNGGGGQDLLAGNKGNDRLVGGNGADRFKFKKGDGKDRIKDFEDGIDKIAIGKGAKKISDLTIIDNGTDAKVKFANVSITVEDMLAADLTKADFIL